ncbi:MAG: hypothetical protein ACR2NL_00155 [Acidimicrobiia bacterium]
MWYAASEILIFLVIALLLGAAAGFAMAQTYTISLSRSKEKGRANAKAAKELTAARAQITELQRLVAGSDSGMDTAGTRLSQRVGQASDSQDDDVPEAEAV